MGGEGDATEDDTAQHQVDAVEAVPLWYFQASEVYDFIVERDAVCEHQLPWSWITSQLKNAPGQSGHLSEEQVES